MESVLSSEFNVRSRIHPRPPVLVQCRLVMQSREMTFKCKLSKHTAQTEESRQKTADTGRVAP